ncbi:MAG TPA: peroxide stress protein YaaA [Saprospiraceae bacterium]|nr:peroxide stress protein YaaA [Saprospiraceae bacterium]
MIAIISPSKDLNYKSELPMDSGELPRMLEDSSKLLTVLKKKKSRDLMKMMDISEKLAHENVLRYQNFSSEFTSENSRPAIFAFAGDVYRGLDAGSLNKKQLKYTQSHLRILSGLYGLLRPLDRMQPYRLEMGVPLAAGKTKNLYGFWGSRITDLLNQDLQETKSKYLINLASKEYYDAVREKELKAAVIHIHFRELKSGQLRFVSYTAKRARGLMARYMALEGCKKPEDLKGFNLEDYAFDASLSNDSNWYFVR